MSNCINFDHQILKLTADDCRTEELMFDLTAHKDHDPYPKPPAVRCEDPICYVAYWFLNPDYNVYRQTIVTSTICIILGNGRSSHTWRDLRGTVNALLPYMKRVVTRTYRCTDESDGFREAFDMEIKFGEEMR